MADQQSNISLNPKSAYAGLNLNSVTSQIKQGQLSWAVNAVIENWDGNSITYQNEQKNELCDAQFPSGYKIVGKYNVIEDGIIVFWLANPTTGDSEIGTVQDCVYTKKINDPCIGLSIYRPILKAVHRHSSCGGLEIYWTDGTERKFIDLSNLPFRTIKGCPDVVTTEVDCNLMRVQPNFIIPQLEPITVDADGELTAGTYQYAIAYADAQGVEYTSYYSVTNPISIFDPTKITLDFNYKVSKSINVKITNIDTTGFFSYYNLAVIKTINNIASVDLVGTFQIVDNQAVIAYTGQGVQNRLTVSDIFQKYPIYKNAGDLTTAQDILIWSNLTEEDRISYQKIANQITIEWQTWKMPTSPGYANPLVAAYLRGYMRDEVYPLELVPLLKSGKQCDGFHIPGRVANAADLEPIAGADVVGPDATKCDPVSEPKPRWQVYNTGCFEGYSQEYINFTSGVIGGKSSAAIQPPTDTNPKDASCYIGPYQYGCMAYWQSTDVYPCNTDVWGDLANKPIRHHKFPDSLITHIHDNQENVYPIGIRVNVQQIWGLIQNSSLSPEQKADIVGFKIVRGSRVNNKSIVAKGLIQNVGKYNRDEQTYFFPNYPYNDLREDPFLQTQQSTTDSGRNESTRLRAFTSDDSKQRWTFHSPDTHFFQPTLGNTLKLETAEFGTSKGHFQQVKNHSRYKFLTSGAYTLSLAIAVAIGALSATVGVSTQVFDGTAAFTAYQTLIDIIENVSPRANFAYQYNSIGQYTDFKPVQNAGNKQRFLDIASYMAPGMISVGDVHVVNNFQRESSIYVKTASILPYPSTIAGVPVDTSRYLNSDVGCGGAITETPISSYYASIKKISDNQYGQIYSYETVDTGFQWFYSGVEDLNNHPIYYIFGGDVFINRFAYKEKLPFFIDNRVSSNNARIFADDADISYSQLGNVAYPNYWMDTDSAEGTAFSILGIDFGQFFGVKANNLDCDTTNAINQKGKIYLFSYGIPYFYTESEVNVDLRQAFNGAEGDFFPRVSSDIPDDWLQETNTTIQQDNTYYYNITYSKQNKENIFTHLPEDWDACVLRAPFRAIFSDPQRTTGNNWLTYRPSAYFDFPQNYGALISLDGIETRQVLARFENKTLLYNALLTAPTSAADVYLGQPLFSSQVPPLDYSDTDLGYIGTQHKFFLKTEYGHITADAKRGQIFALNGQQSKEITNENVSKFFTTYLDFQLKKAFPTYNVDNNFLGVGLHGVFDNKYNRLIITKLDYKPLSNNIILVDNKFYVGTTEIELTDTNYFQNYSFTASYSFDIQNWVSLHTYLPNFYIGEANYFYTGINSTPSIWRHNTSETGYNNFYGEIHPYILEYPYAFQYNDEILQNVKDYTKTIQYDNWQSFIEPDDVWFNKAELYNNQQHSGVLEMVQKPQNNLNQTVKYPIYNTDSKTITWTKRDNFYQINTFWGLNKSSKTPNYIPSTQNLSLFKEINQSNMDYNKRSYKKEPLRAKDLRVRLILDNRDDTKLLSMLQTTATQKSYI